MVYCSEEYSLKGAMGMKLRYLGTAAARDAVKREALRRAGVAYIEVTPSHDLAGHLSSEVARVAAEMGLRLAA